MNAEKRRFKHKDLTEAILGVFFEVYKELGHGFLESVYENAMCLALESKGMSIARQIAVPVWFRGTQVGNFFADLLVEEKVLVELKAVRLLDLAHEAQVLNYLRATGIEVGMLLNFGLKVQYKRFAYDNERKSFSYNAPLTLASLTSGNKE